jgi:hypothetical protein
MTSLYATTSRLIEERLEALLNAGQPLDGRTDDSNAQLMRLAGAGLALAQQHTVDGKGRCRICTRRRRLYRRRMRPCSVYSALSFYLTQPDELVQQVLPELAPARPTRGHRADHGTTACAPLVTFALPATQQRPDQILDDPGSRRRAGQCFAGQLGHWPIEVWCDPPGSPP